MSYTSDFFYEGRIPESIKDRASLESKGYFNIMPKNKHKRKRRIKKKAAKKRYA